MNVEIGSTYAHTISVEDLPSVDEMIADLPVDESLNETDALIRQIAEGPYDPAWVIAHIDNEDLINRGSLLEIFKKTSLPLINKEKEGDWVHEYNNESRYFKTLMLMARVIPSDEYSPYLRGYFEDLSKRGKEDYFYETAESIALALGAIGGENTEYLEEYALSDPGINSRKNKITDSDFDSYGSNNDRLVAASINSLAFFQSDAYLKNLLDKYPSWRMNKDETGMILQETYIASNIGEKKFSSVEKRIKSLLNLLVSVNSDQNATHPPTDLIIGAHLEENLANLKAARLLNNYFNSHPELFLKLLEEKSLSNSRAKDHLAYGSYLLGLPLSDEQKEVLRTKGGLSSEQVENSRIIWPIDLLAPASNISDLPSESGEIIESNSGPEIIQATINEPQKELSEQNRDEGQPGGFPWPIVGAVAVVAAIGGAAMMRKK